MKLKVGDKVKFLNDVGGGKVTRIIDNQMVEVLNEDGFEVPVLKDELLKTEEAEEQDFEEQTSAEEYETFSSSEEEELTDIFDNKKEEDLELGSSADPRNRIYLAFVPEEPNRPEQADIDVYLINDSDFYLNYLLFMQKEYAYVHFASGELENDTKIFLRTIPRDKLNQLGNIRCQMIFYKKGYFYPIAPEDATVKIQPSKLFKSSTFLKNDFFEEKAIITELRKENLFNEKLNELTREKASQVVQEKEQTKEQKRQYLSSKREDTEEIDLHIEELVEKPKELTNAEMLDIQMGRFKTALEGALKSQGIKKIVFIHGVGNGRLRYELRQYLERNYPNLDFQDASFKEYGYGATLVLLKNKK